MSKVWRIARHHFIQESSKRSFLLVLFSLPIFIILVMGLNFLFVRLAEPTQIVGYVDQAELLGQTEIETEDSKINLIGFVTIDEAQSALESEQIDAYFVLPPDYRQTHQSELFYLNDPPRGAQRQFSRFIITTLLANRDPVEIERILEGADITVSATDTNREFASGGPGSGQLLPLVAAAIFAFSILTISGYMLDVVVVEKENRTIEIIISSLSPGRMISGKIIGAIGIAALQIVVWVFFVVVAIWIGGHLLNNDWLLAIDPVWRDLILVIFVAIPNYVLITALMVAIGSTLVESQEAQQIGPFAFLILMLPIYLLIPIAANPNGPIALLLTFFPPTSVVTLGMRSLIIEVPLWQFAVAALVSAAAAVAAIWLAIRVFRISLLRYGQRLKITDLLRLSAAEKSAAASS